MLFDFTAVSHPSHQIRSGTMASSGSAFSFALKMA